MDTELNLMVAPFGTDPVNADPYPPNPTQQKVLDWVDKVRAGEKVSQSDGIPVLYLQGGVGSGKTRALLAPVIEMLLEINKLRVFWGRQDFMDLKLSAMETFFEALPEEVISDKSEQYHWYDISSGRTKSRIYFNGLKDLGGLGSQEYGVIVVTEVFQISLSAYRTIKQRARQAQMPLMILMEGNPPNKGHWLSKVTNPTNKEYDPDITMWKLSTYENWNNLSSKYKTSLEAMPPAWKKKYLYGEFGFTPDGTPFYDGFNEVLHKRSMRANPHKSLLIGWDYGWHHPACVITQFDEKGRWCILRALMGTGVTIDKFADEVKVYLNVHFPRYPIRGYSDPAGKQKKDTSEKTSIEILSSKGFPTISKASTYRERKEIIERLLSTLIVGLPSLLVDPSCSTIVDGFSGGYHYPMIKEGAEFRPIKTEAPYKDGYYEHQMNALEYIAVNIFRPVRQANSDDKQPGYRFGKPKGAK